MDFICFSINAWEKRRARKQQFMWHLSLRPDVGKVLYVEPSLNIWRLFLLPFVELSSCEKRIRWRRALTFCPERVSDKFLVFTPIFFIPFAFRFLCVYNINLYLLYLHIYFISAREKMRDIAIWLYHPFDIALLNWFKHRLVSCFDWAEEWAEYFIEYSKKQREEIRRLEEKMVSSVDIVFVVSKALLEPARALNKNSYQIYDGSDPGLFESKYTEAPFDLRNVRHPIIGYIGTISHRVDVELVKILSERMPDFSFVFIGNVHTERVDIGHLSGRPNVFFLGGKAYEELPHYAAFFDACLLPYKPLLFMSPPTKVFDYLAAGKPIVSSKLPELGFIKDFIYEAETINEFEAGIKMAVNDDSPEAVIRRKDKARQNSWARRAEEIMSLIRK